MEINRWLYFIALGVGSGAVLWTIAKNIPTILTACKSGRIYQTNPAECINIHDGKNGVLYHVWQVFPDNGSLNDLLVHDTTEEKLPEYFMIHPENHAIVSLSWKHLREMRKCTRIANDFTVTGFMDDDFMMRCADAQKTNEQKTAPPAS